MLLKWRRQRSGSPLQRSRSEDSLNGSCLFRRAALICFAGLPLFTAACNDQGAQNQATAIGGNAARGVALIRKFGCGTCHLIPGVEGADGMVAPPLLLIGRRVFLAGVLRNTPENMMAWIQDPQRFVPGNAMPGMGVSREEARDIVSYLYTLR